MSIDSPVVLFTILDRRDDLPGDELWEARCEGCGAQSRFWRRRVTGSQWVAMRHADDCPIRKDVEMFDDH